MRACASGHEEIVKYLIERYACDPRLTNKNEEDSLMIAVRNKQTEVVRYLSNLLKGQVDVECKRNGLTPFLRAVL